MRAVAVVVALAAIGVAVYRSHHHRLTVYSGGDLPLPVLHATGFIQKGTTGYAIEKGFLFTVQAVRRSEIPSGAIVTPDSLKGKVALKNIPAGAELEQLTSAPSTATARCAFLPA